MSIEDDDCYIPIASLNQYLFCEHRCWRIFCTGEFFDNHYTLEGESLHERVHTVGSGKEGETWRVRAVYLKSDRLGIIGKADLLEENSGIWMPVEYKRGSIGNFVNDAVQLCAQALCLEDMTNTSVPVGFVYYAETHQRLRVDLDEKLRGKTIATIAAVRALIHTGIMPVPLFTERCSGCSAFDACLPKTRNKLTKYKELD